MTGEETFPDPEDVADTVGREITRAITEGDTILVVGFDSLHAQGFTVGAVEALEADGVEIEIREPGNEYLVVATDAEISVVALSPGKHRRVRGDRKILALVLGGEEWPDGLEQAAVTLMRNIVDMHRPGGLVIGRVP